jgi:hypothetical protein
MTAYPKLNNDAKMNNDAKFRIVSSFRRGVDPVQNSEIFVGGRVRFEPAQLDKLARGRRQAAIPDPNSEFGEISH